MLEIAFWPQSLKMCIFPEENHYFLDKNRSPEEMRHEVNYIDEKIDVYSMGNIFYKLITSEVR